MAESMVDVFGRRKIYPTNTHPNRAKPWFLGEGDWSFRRYNGVGDWNDCPISTENNIVTINFDTDTDKGRFPVLALRGSEYPVDVHTDNLIIVSLRNQRKLRKRGYMGTKNDWKNVEITMYFKIKQATNGAMAFSVRGGPHHSSGFFGDKCVGTAYYVKLTFDGLADINKELGHPDYAQGKISEESVMGLDGNGQKITDIKDRWIGMKGVFYNKANGNPFIELWLDKEANNNWERILWTEDDGNWFLESGVNNDCDGQRNEQITWGGPGVIFKLDRLNRVDMKWASVREIMPPEGWPLRYLLEARGVSFPVSMLSLAEEYGLTIPISLRELSELEAERPR